MDMFGRTVRKIKIGENEFSITLLKGREGWRVAEQLGKVILPLIGESFDAGKHDEIIHGAPTTFRDLALVFIEQMDKLNTEEIIFDKLLKDVKVDGEVVAIEEVIVGNYDILVELLMFALKENFGSFFSQKGFITRFQSTIQTVMNPTTTS